MKLLLTVFAVTFMAELPDKTALTTFVMSSRRSPLAVFAGGAAAMVLHTALAVWLGSLLSALPAEPVRILAGCVFLAFAFLIWRRKDEDAEEANPGQGAKHGFLPVAFASFVAIFLAEWGDLTQFSTASLSARFGRPWPVFFGAVAGLWCAIGLTAWLGRQAGTAISKQALQRMAAIVFMGMGLWILL
jgi:putative Ca2+/H+ antiporter (TMEM165/GDT1 family)